MGLGTSIIWNKIAGGGDEMYIFVENKENERTETLEQFPFASENIERLKEAIANKYKKQATVSFQRKYGAVLEKYTGDLLGWIRKVGKVV
jgi:hypothetical protein